MFRQNYIFSSNNQEEEEENINDCDRTGWCTYPNIILEIVGRFKLLVFVEKEPGIYVEQRKSFMITLFFTYLLILGLTSAILLGISITILAESYSIHGLFKYTDAWDISWILFCVGILCLIGFIIGLLFYSSCNPIYLITYCTCIGISLILVIATLWLSVVFYEKYSVTYEEDLYIAIYNYEVKGKDYAKRIVDSIQTYHQCCGVKNQSDWLPAPYFLNETRFPDSCCILKFKQVFCGDSYALINSYKGCLDNVYTQIYKYIIYLITFSSIALFVLFFGAFIMFSLFSKARKTKF